MTEPVIVIIGAGGVGLAAARRLASGRKIILGSRSQQCLEDAKSALGYEGHQIETHQVDIADSSSVNSFAKQAAAAGRLDVIVHTSGISPNQGGTVDGILNTNLLGTAHVVDAFLPYVGPGTSLIVVSSISAYMASTYLTIPPAVEKHLATAPTAQLLQSPDLDLKAIGAINPPMAYTFSKRVNNLRVQGSVVAYGAKGARINSVSPAVIMTKLGYAEMEGPDRARATDYIKDSGGLKRHATPQDVAGVIAFLAGSDASYISGADILMDGGSYPGMTWNPRELSDELKEVRASMKNPS